MTREQKDITCYILQHITKLFIYNQCQGMPGSNKRVIAEVKLHSLLISVLDGVKLPSRSDRFTHGGQSPITGWQQDIGE